uniref:Uncharacterized protein n=1 Tax=Amphora coffeiformis TaxID=265554 RepID=A0A7S3L2I4_9STRA
MTSQSTIPRRRRGGGGLRQARQCLCTSTTRNAILFVAASSTVFLFSSSSSSSSSSQSLHLPLWLTGTQAFVPLTVSSFPATRTARTTTATTVTLRHESQRQHAALLPRLRGLPLPGNVDVDDVDTDKQQQQQDSETYETAIRNTILSIAVSIAFGAGLWWTVGPQVGQEFFAGYIVEKSLSVDNLFVFLMLFEYFQVPLPYQGRVLSWGICGSIIMRALMISLGAAALHKFRAILLLFAAILIYSAAQVLVDEEQAEETGGKEDLSDNFIVQVAQSVIPSTNTYDGDRFFTLQDGIRKATPLFGCMLAVELSDVVFAVDSIPAVFGVTENPLVVFTSNMFAILGLRSLYPVLSKAATDLKYLEPAVAIILAFIGAKMVAEYFGYTIPTEGALGFIVTMLSVGIGASVWEKQQSEQHDMFLPDVTSNDDGNGE